MCFAWLDYLKASALQDCLGIEDRLVLTRPMMQQQEQQEDDAPSIPAAGAAAVGAGAAGLPSASNSSSSDSRSSNTLSSPEQLVMQLLRYSAACEQDDFNNASHSCNICFDQVGRKQGRRGGAEGAELLWWDASVRHNQSKHSAALHLGACGNA